MSTLITINNLLLGVGLAIFSVVFTKFYDKWHENRENRKFEAKQSNIKPERIIIPKDAEYQEYLDYAFHNETSRSGVLEPKEAKEVHAFLAVKCAELHSTELDRGWEELSLSIVEHKLFGVHRESITSDENQDYVRRCYGKKSDMGVDSYIIQKDSGREHYGITLIQSKWHDLTEHGFFRSDNFDVISKLAAAAKYIHVQSTGVELDNGYRLEEIKFLSGLVNNWRTLTQDYHRDSQDDKYKIPPRIRLVVVHHRGDQSVQWSTMERQEKAVSIDAIQAKEILQESEQIFNILSSAKPKKVDIQYTKMTSNLISTNDDMDVYVGGISGLQLALLYQSPDFTEARKDFGVLQMNVRRRLSDKTESDTADFRDDVDVPKSINSSMRETIEGLNGQLPHRFVAYNNGITIVCSDFKEISTNVRQIKSLQIVNGGQTTEMMFDYYKNGKEDLIRNIMVPIKVISLKGKVGMHFINTSSDVAARVNHQNPTQPRQLHSNDPRFLYLEKAWGRRTPKMYLGVKENEWEQLSEAEDEEKDKIKKGTGKRKKDYMYSGTARKIDLEQLGQIRWAILGGGAIPAASKEQIWPNRVSIFNTRNSTPPYYGLPASSTVFDESDYEPFTLLEDEEGFFDDVMFAKILHEELKILKKKKGYFTKAANELTDELERQKRVKTTESIAFPLFNILAINEVLRVRCSSEFLKNDTASMEENRQHLLTFFLGEERSISSSRANTWPFYTDSSRSLQKKWDDLVAREPTSFNILRRFVHPAKSSHEESLFAVVELVTTNLRKIIYDAGLTPKAINRNKTSARNILNELIKTVKSGDENKRLLSIPLGDPLKTNQIDKFESTMNALRTFLEA